VQIRIQQHLEAIDWEQVKRDLAADDFDNGRSGPALRRSFEAAQHVAMAVDGQRCVGSGPSPFMALVPGRWLHNEGNR
jgi:hypothetical protein